MGKAKEKGEPIPRKQTGNGLKPKTTGEEHSRQTRTGTLKDEMDFVGRRWTTWRCCGRGTFWVVAQASWSVVRGGTGPDLPVLQIN
jgi:hypothetical protein